MADAPSFRNVLLMRNKTLDNLANSTTDHTVLIRMLFEDPLFPELWVLLEHNAMYNVNEL
jgi:hypothetical protein